MQIGVRALRNRTKEVIDAVRSGERVTLTVRGEAVADVVPHQQRSRWRAGNTVRQQIQEYAADPGLSDDLEEIAGQTLDEV